MIRIIKGEAPAHLVDRGIIETSSDNEKYLAERAEYDSGANKFEAKSSIYNSDHVRNALLQLQHGKCCYCETKDVRSNSDVEHYRPKAAYSSEPSGVSNYPGYFWLAYEWDNLFLSCQVCNQIFKNDFFPIVDESKRAQKNNLSIEEELPILIHPSFDIPEEEIAYRESIPYGLTDRGEKTIEYLGFGKVDPEKDISPKQKARIKLLVEKRQEYYELMKSVYLTMLVLSAERDISEGMQELIDKAKDTLERAQQPKAEWSAMIKCAIANDFRTF